MRTKTRPHINAARGPSAPHASAPAPVPTSTVAMLSLAEQLDTTRRELDAVYAQLERLNRLASIGTIAGMIAHEFNNILTPIMSYSQMAADAPGDRELAAKALSKALAGSERAAKIADAILGFVRDEANPLTDMFHVEHDAPTFADVHVVVRDALNCLASDSGRDHVGTTVRIPKGARAAIAPIALQQVLVNLILNARNAMRSNGGALEITARQSRSAPATPAQARDSRVVTERSTGLPTPTDMVDAPARPSSGWISIQVQDTGRGMGPEQLARMFRPFETDSAGERRGTGLGMIITKRLVERVGGWLTIESALSRGTTTTIVLPMA